MSFDSVPPIIAFVWRPADIKSAVVQAARSTGSRAIFDLSAIELDRVGPALLKADAGSDAVDLKISPAALMRDGLAELLEETGGARLWVELHPRLLPGDPRQYLRRIEELSDKLAVIPIMGDPSLISLAMDEFHLRSVALKGSEAAGFVSGETIFTLYASIRERVRDRGEAADLFVWGGITAPEAAAAFLSAGAAGIIFESLHWLTDLTGLDDEMRQRISKLQPDHTDLTGLNLEAPCRLYNKGNSRAVKELKDFAGSLCGSEISHEQRAFFASKIQTESVHPLDSKFGREELIPLGVEATFAASFVRRFGLSAEEAIDGFIRAVERICATAAAKLGAFVGSPVAAEMGTRYPFVQGAMSWITDVPEFARAVADAGALPTVALGLMDGNVLEEKLGRLPQIMGERPYATNVITLPENPHRDVQLAWIKKIRPRFAVIAAGEPAHAAELVAEGIDVIYIAPTEQLLKMALEAGIHYVVCEGHEAGGHVGQHSTLTLAQMVIDLRDREPGLFEGSRLILAGGVFNRETSFMASMLGADAVQMGTAYLTTEEIVETFALTQTYQRMILQSDLAGTVITGEGTGLRVRSLKTPRIDAVCALEREFASGSEAEASFRHKIEALTAGSLLVAARGTLSPGGEPLDEATRVEQGQFMSGACAGALKKVMTLKELHREVAESPLAVGLPFLGPIRETESGPVVETVAPAARQRADRASRPSPVPLHGGIERIAITGFSIANSLGNSPEEVWAASLGMKSGVVAVPPAKWNHELFYDPRPRAPEKTYCRVGAFMNLEVSRKDIGIPPQDFRTMTGSTKMTMWLAGTAIDDSGILESEIPRERIAVIVSQNSGEAAATLQDVIIRGSLDKIVSSVKKVVDLTPENQKAVEDEIKTGRIAIDDTTLLGRLNCTAGGFICNKYGFMGPSWSVSAACATALVAMYNAVQMIRNGVIDAAIVGGAEELLTPMHFLEFSALGALAGISGAERSPSEASRPFDQGRDGMVLGEGGGFIVIERESLAKKRGARIHAYITSMGASNNHLGMVESSRITQEIAIRASFPKDYYGPEDVDLIECHATSTLQGDVEEVQALKQFFDGGRATVLTSFKSQIGHTLGASGINSLIRGIMAMKAGVFPPTLNYGTPDPEMELNGSNLIIHSQPAEWPRRDSQPRRLQVNAFGFGGSNYVVQVEQAAEDEDIVMVSLSEPLDSGQEVVSGKQRFEGISLFRTEIGGSPYRLAVVAATEQEAISLVERAEPFTNGGPVARKRIRALARQGLHLGPEDSAVPPLSFVFPGQGSHYAGMSRELYETFPVIRQWMDRAQEVAEFDLLHLLFYDQEEDLQKTRWQQPALFTMEYAMVQYFVSLGITPKALAGHSLGELTAMCLAGVYSFEDGFRLVNERAVCMDKACEMNVDPGVMMAVDAPMSIIEEKMAKTEGIYITNLNSPRQIVIGGDTEKVKEFGEELKQAGHRRTLLRVSMAFHSPIMRCIHDELEEFISGIEFHPPKIPVISNTTTMPYPDDTAEIKRIVMAHLESPVHWMQNVKTLWNDYGVRLFVEVGPRDVLSNMIRDTFEEADCIQTSLPSAEALIYRTAMAQLYAAGHLRVSEKPRFVSFPKVAKATDSALSLKTSAKSSPLPAAPASIDRIIQREVNAFVVESFGRFLKPSILEAIRREYDPNFTEEHLNQLFPQTLSVTDSTLSASSAAPAQRPIAHPSIPSAQVSSAGAVRETVPHATPTEDITESVIRIVMDATGYERDEIEPDMDLREDLSIRSSRLPIIMDAVEGQFAIKIELEQFMDVRTIRDISDRIAAILAKKSAKEDSGRAEGPKAEVSLVPGPGPGALERKRSLKRLVFREVRSDSSQVQPVELQPGESVVVLSAEGGTGLRQSVGGVFRRDYGAHIIPMTFMDGALAAEDGGGDLRTEEGAASAVRAFGEVESLAGLVFVLDEVLEARVNSMEEITAILKGFFTVLKTFLESSSKKFVILLEKNEYSSGRSRLLAEGALGMFLSASHEFGSVQFRTVRITQEADLRDALRAALDRSRKVLETAYRDGTTFTVEGAVAPAVFKDAPGTELNSEDVVVFSGGAYGITPFVAQTLVPFGCKMVFLGRTVIDNELDFDTVVRQEISGEQAARLLAQGSLAGSDRGVEPGEIARIAKQVEILRTLGRLRSSGIEAEYITCDVTDAERTAAVLEDIRKKFGRISGIIHAAGVLKDAFVRQMTLDDFATVVDVKFLGAWNLFNAVEASDLRFFVCLSSGAAIQGNPGQVNYAAGNRMMSALLKYLAPTNGSIRFKALMLAPIEGAGMAEDEEVRALMKRMNAEYLHAEELAGLVCQELFVAPPEDVWVLFMRSLPELTAVMLDTSEPSTTVGTLRGAAVEFKVEDFPLIEKITRVDLEGGQLEATRSFSQESDLWIPDHKPFKFMKHPLVSAIMGLETFMEAARMLFPYLKAHGVRDAQFLDIIECPPGIQRFSEISCRRVNMDGDEITCEVALATREISPSGRITDRMFPNYKAFVILGAGECPRLNQAAHDAFVPVKLDSRPMDHSEVLALYQGRTDLLRRYRVIEDLSGTVAGAIRGRMVYRQNDDFAPPRNPSYQYSPYLLEALMQVVNFYIVMRNPEERRSMIPFRIGEMLFARKCRDGEEIVLEARMKQQTDEGIIWDARGLDADGRIVMQASELVMRWFTK